MSSFTPLQTLKGHKGPIYVVKFNKTGLYCMSGSQDRFINLWNPAKGTLIKQYSGAHNYEIQDLLITADNSRFASCGGDKSLFVWDVKQGKVITKIQAHDFKINTIDWNLENSVIASGSDDSTVKFWDLKAVTYRPIQTVRDFKDSISKIMIKEHKVYISSLDNNLRIYDLRMGDMTTDFMNGPILSFDVSNDQKLYATVNQNQTIKIVEKTQGEVLQTIQTKVSKEFKTECVFDFQDSQIICGQSDGLLVAYDILTGKPVKVGSNHSRALTSIDIHHPTKLLLTASIDNTITLWNQNL